MKSDTLLLLGGAAVLGYVIYKKIGSLPTDAANSVIAGGTFGYNAVANGINTPGGLLGQGSATDIGYQLQQLLTPAANPNASTSSTPFGYPQVQTGIIGANGVYVPSTSTNWLPSWGIGGDIQTGINSLGGISDFLGGLLSPASDVVAGGTFGYAAPAAAVVPWGSAGNNAQNPIMQTSEAASIASGQTVLGIPIGTPAIVPTYTAAYIAGLPTSAATANGGAYQSGNGGYNTGIKYF